MYTAFATVYDRLMADVPYDKWALHYLKLLQKYNAQGKKCVECACGSGSLTIPLYKLGMKMTGVDVSAPMLEIAMQKAREAGCDIPFVRQDMCKLHLPSKAHAILSTCDGVNYLTQKRQLNAFFNATYGNLRQGGVLIMDVSTPYKLMEVLGNETRTYVDQEYAYIWHNKANKQSKLLTMELTIFSKTNGEMYARVEEKQIQRAYTMQEIEQALLKAGFATVHFYGQMRMRKPLQHDMRWHIVAEKM